MSTLFPLHPLLMGCRANLLNHHKGLRWRGSRGKRRWQTHWWRWEVASRDALGIHQPLPWMMFNRRHASSFPSSSSRICGSGGSGGIAWLRLATEPSRKSVGLGFRFLLFPQWLSCLHLLLQTLKEVYTHIYLSGEWKTVVTHGKKRTWQEKRGEKGKNRVGENKGICLFSFLSTTHHGQSISSYTENIPLSGYPLQRAAALLRQGQVPSHRGVSVAVPSLFRSLLNPLEPTWKQKQCGERCEWDDGGKKKQKHVNIRITKGKKRKEKGNRDQ